MHQIARVAAVSDMPPHLHAAYAACRRIHRRHDPTYYLATRRLPAEVRPAVHALYAFVRSADELVDGPRRAPMPDARRAALDRLEEDLWQAVGGGVARGPAVAALVDAGARHDLPLAELRTYMESMRRDCGPVRIASRAELARYMNGSAAAVGRIMAPLLGAPPQAHESFAQLGVAFQLTNFIRDVAEDVERGRMYLPQEDLDRFGVTADHLRSRQVGPELRRLLAFEIARTRALYRRAEAGWALLPPASARCIRTAHHLYAGILDAVEASDYQVFRVRAAVPAWRKALVAAREMGAGSAWVH